MATDQLDVAHCRRFYLIRIFAIKQSTGDAAAKPGLSTPAVGAEDKALE